MTSSSITLSKPRDEAPSAGTADMLGNSTIGMAPWPRPEPAVLRVRLALAWASHRQLATALAGTRGTSSELPIEVRRLDAGRMPWTAPQITRHDTPYVAGERQTLEAWLDFHRQTLLSKCSGLITGQLRQRAAPPSSLSLLGLIRHMAEVERGWFRRRVAGEQVGFLYSSEADPDGDFDHVDTADAGQDFAAYLREIDLAHQAATGRYLEETFFHSHRNAQMSVRWVYVHMIEEYARHDGHADLLRERIDCATGL